MTDIDKELKAFFLEMTRVPFAYGVNDCALAPATWLERIKGVNPASHLIGTYHDLDTCIEVLQRERGLLRIMWFMGKRLGLPRTTEPKVGDVALVRIRKIHFGAIHFPGDRWGIKMSNGMTITRSCKPVVIWSI